jgi:hypothetical protein
MKKIQLPIIFCSIIILLSVLSCRKTDFASQDSGKSDALIEAQFFNAYRTDNPNEKKLVDYFKRLNDKTHFVVPTVKKIGYPRWNKILATELNNTASSFQSNSTSDSLNVSYIPFVIENDSVVNSSMVIKTTPSDTTFNILNNWQYADSATTNMSPKRFMIFMMALDKNVFGDRLYKITDTTAFGKSIQNRNTKYLKINDVSIGTTGNANLVAPLTLEICYITYEVGGQIAACPPGAEHCISLIAIAHCTDYDLSGIGGGGGGNGSTGGPGPGSTGNTGNGNTGGGNTPGGGPCVNCGGWTPVLTGINYLIQTLSLTPAEIIFLNQHPFLKEQLYYYNSVSPNWEKIVTSKQFIFELMADPSYLLFCQNQSNNSDSGNVWWKDEDWLRQVKYQIPQKAFNFYMRKTRPPGEKPEEFLSLCDGLKAIAERTKNDSLERLGYITYDGKFIFTNVGSGDTVKMNIRAIGNSIYYAYPISLGMPSQTYYGTITDSAAQEILIQIRASVHTHPRGGVSIDFPNSKSEYDLFMAQQVYNYSTTFNNFVIEPFIGNTYKTGRFNSDEYDNRYYDTHSNLTLSDICNYIIP